MTSDKTGLDETENPMEQPQGEAESTTDTSPTPQATSSADTVPPDGDVPVAETESSPESAEEPAAAESAVEEVSTEAAEQEPSAETPASEDEQPSGEMPDEPADEPTSEEEVVSAEEPEEAESAAAATEAPAETGRRLRRGDLIEGKILSTSPTSVIVDLGEGLEGIITGRELERMTRQTLEALQEGEEINVFVVNPNDHQGNVILSVNRAMEEMDWHEADRYRESQEVYEGNVAGYNKGGLIVRFGRLRGFVPQSQIADDRRRQMDGETPEERYGAMVNEPIAVKVMEVDRSRNRLILSERAATREIREKRKRELIDRLNVGDVIVGQVVSLEDFGAFVDIGGAEGLVHLTEMSWRHVTHPRELVKVGEEVKVEVISVDPDRSRIGLSMKRQEIDPWDEVAMTYDQGQLVQATVTKLTKFGAFAQLVDSPEIEGLIHISELSDNRVSHPREVVKEGEKLTLRVVKVDVKNRRLGLSLKRVDSAEYLDRDMDFFTGDDET